LIIIKIKTNIKNKSSPIIIIIMESTSIEKLQRLIDKNYKIEKIQPIIFGSDAEINIITLTLVSEDGKKESIRAYGEESHQLREYIRKNALYQNTGI
jgi:hypothetical protein